MHEAHPSRFDYSRTELADNGIPVAWLVWVTRTQFGVLCPTCLGIHIHGNQLATSHAELLVAIGHRESHCSHNRAEHALAIPDDLSAVRLAEFIDTKRCIGVTAAGAQCRSRTTANTSGMLCKRHTFGAVTTLAKTPDRGVVKPDLKGLSKASHISQHTPCPERLRA